MVEINSVVRRPNYDMLPDSIAHQDFPGIISSFLKFSRPRFAF